MVRDIQHARCPAGPAASSATRPPSTTGHEVTGEPELARTASVASTAKEQFGKWFPVAEGFSIVSTILGAGIRCGTTIDEPMKGFARPPTTPGSSVRGRRLRRPPQSTPIRLVDMSPRAPCHEAGRTPSKWRPRSLKKIYG